MGPKPVDKYRLAFTCVLLTYTAPFECEQILAVIAASTKVPVAAWRWCREVGPKTGLVHTHFFCRFTRRVDSRNPRFFDLGPAGHPNVEVLNTLDHVRNAWAYCAKDGDYLSEGVAEEEFVGSIQERVKRARNLWDACDMLGISPKTVADVQMLRRDTDLEPDVVPLHITNFVEPFQEFVSTLFVTGPSGIGKTQWVLANLHHLGLEPVLFVRHIDQLAQLTSRHKSVVFDDMAFSHWPSFSVIHLLDWEMPSSINVRYKCARIPAKLPRVFTSNLPFENVFMGMGTADAHKVAIYRRMRCRLSFEQPLFLVPEVPTVPVTPELVALADTCSQGVVACALSHEDTVVVPLSPAFLGKFISTLSYGIFEF